MCVASEAIKCLKRMIDISTSLAEAHPIVALVGEETII